MKTLSPTFGRAARSGLLLLGALLTARPAAAFPPNPYHLLYGMVSDEYGIPLLTPQAKVVFEASSGARVSISIDPGIEAAANYRLEVPMDANLLGAPYRASAMRPLAPFRLKVEFGGVTYLPLQMTGDAAHLGQPGQRTRMDLTLGEDVNGDGLPDAWQRRINADISQVAPGGDAGNGLTYLQAYQLGLYAVSPTNGFRLEILSPTNGLPRLEFMGVTGRRYLIESSSDLNLWTPVSFRVPAEGAGSPLHDSFMPAAIGPVRAEVGESSAPAGSQYFRLILRTSSP